MNEVTLLAMRVLFMAVVPIVVGIGIAGLIAGAFQSATTVHDRAISYAIKCGAAVVVLYILVPHLARALVTLAQGAFQ